MVFAFIRNRVQLIRVRSIRINWTWLAPRSGCENRRDVSWRAQRASLRETCADAFANLARTEAVRADHRLRTDDEAIRAQSTIWG
jgi:hypothetical protein